LSIDLKSLNQFLITANLLPSADQQFYLLIASSRLLRDWPIEGGKDRGTEGILGRRFQIGDFGQRPCKSGR